MKNILIIHKKSTFELLGNKNPPKPSAALSKALKSEQKYFRHSHKSHNETLNDVLATLKSLHLKYKCVYRESGIQFHKYDLIITVGGDGTFLKAAAHTTNQLMLGVNSAREFSVGKLCSAHQDNFKEILQALIDGKIKPTPLYRLELRFSHLKEPMLALNDCLIAHKVPADMSRYLIKCGSVEEKQRSSGIWVATAVGSTGAIKSAGGKVIPATDKKFQYQPRELYANQKQSYRLNGSVLSARSELRITSLMQKGVVYIDGSRLKVPFTYGSELRVKLSSTPIQQVRV